MVIIADKILIKVDKPTLVNCALIIRGNAIVAVGPQDRIARDHRRDRILRFKNSVLLPGLVNAHAHLELPEIAKPSRSLDYASWVLSLLKAKTGLSSKDYRSAATNNLRDLIRSGTTTVAEITTHNASPAILRKSGIRAVIYHELISMRPDDKVTLPIRKRATVLIRHGLSPHSPHTVSEKTLDFIRRQAKKLPICMHVAETKDELLLFRRRRSGLEKIYSAAGWDREWAPRADSSFKYLYDIGMLGPGFLAVHAVHADGEDINIIARTGASVAHCPRSNRTLSNGTMNLRAMLDAGIPVGLGTDSLASSPSLNLWDEMRAAYSLHRSKGITPKEVLSMATVGGAKALGMQRMVGSLEKGKRADCIVVPLPQKDTGDLCSDLLRETKSSIMTMVNGKILYSRQ